jgi:membrane associated rhomboid family serine protease
MGFMLEGIIGPFKMMQLYIGSSVGGVLFTCLISNNDSVGASIACFGILAGIVSVIFNYFLSWRMLLRIGMLLSVLGSIDAFY